MSKYKFFIFILVYPLLLFSNTTFKIATYNVQNLFDLHYDGNEYKEYIPFKDSKWNKKNFQIKLKNIAKTINDLNADIIALEEIESKRVLKQLMTKLHYPYFAISNKKNSPIIVAILSRYPISKIKSIPVKQKKHYRDILKVKIYINKYPFYIYASHWPSRTHPESQRISYAKTIKKNISWIDEPYVILGDLNSYYDEYKTIKRRRKLNDANGVTGINHILQTAVKYKKKYKMVNKKDLFKNKNLLYNLWLDLDKKKRYSYQYRKKNITLDHILIPYSMIDGKGIDYKKKSFGVFKRKYLFVKKNKINRWQRYTYDWKNRKSIHLGKGYSDHLPIYAEFELIN